MGNKVSCSNNKINENTESINEIEHITLDKSDKEIQLEDTANPVKYDKEIQTQTDIQVDIPKQIESVRIFIVLPNYTYKWDGILEEAPHNIHKMTEIDWTKHMDKIISEKRKSCDWVKEHNRKRQFWIDNDTNSRRGHNNYRDRELWLKYTWDIDPRMPPCSAINFHTHEPRCPGNNRQFQHLINMQKLNKNPKFDGFLYNMNKCTNICYYKHIVEVEIHNLSCKVCSGSALMCR